MLDDASSALPRAILSVSLLADAARQALAHGGHMADLRRDGWGHGLVATAHAVAAAGGAAVLVDSALEKARLREAGVGVDAVTDARADVDARLLYGLPDAHGRTASPPPLRLVGRVMSTKVLRRGEAVSYGYTYRAERDTVVALVTGGYAQGVVRALGNRAQVEIDGALHRMVGRVAMDVCVVDLEGRIVADGTEVTYFGGRGPAAGALAHWAAATGQSVAELAAVAALHAVREETP